MPTGWQILHVPDGVRGRDRRRLRGLLAALHALRRFARPKRPIPRRPTARRPLTAHFRPFCWPFGGISLSPPLLVRAGAFLRGFGQIAAVRRRSERPAGACPSPYAHAGGLRTPSAPEPDHQTTGATRAAGRGRRTRRGKRSAHGQRPGGRPQRQRGCKGARPARNRPRRRRGARERAPRPPL